MKLVNKTLFPILVPDEEDKEWMIETNRIIDSEQYSDEAQLNELKQKSLYRFIIMHGPKTCNFNCPKYCCTEGLTDSYLTDNQLKDVIDQATNLGARVTYWPGLGELTLLKSFWDTQEYLKEKHKGSVVFTNGSLFWNDVLAEEAVSMNSNEIIEKSKEYRIHYYVKYWSSDQEKACQMTGTVKKEYPYAKRNDRYIPLVLAKLIENLPNELVGVEVMVSRENYDDVVNNIFPTINEFGLYAYVEPVIFSGKAAGRQYDFSLSEKQFGYLADTFASGGSYCEKRQSIEMVLIGDKLSPGIVIPPREEDKVIDSQGNVKDIFSIFHNDYFRKMRTESLKLNGCICRAYWNGSLKI